MKAKHILFAFAILVASSPAYAGCEESLDAIDGIKLRISKKAASSCHFIDALLDSIDEESDPDDLPSPGQIEDYLLDAARLIDSDLDLLEDNMEWYRENCPLRARSGIGDIVRDTVERAL